MEGNRISVYNEDALSTLTKLEDESIDLILTDPPYNLGKFMKDRQTNLKQMRSNFFADAGWDNLNYDDWKNHMDSFLKEADRVMKKRSAMIMFMSLMKIETIVDLASKYRFYYKTTGIWHKTNPMPRNMNLHFVNSTEGWIYFINKGKTGIFNNEGKSIHDFIESSVAPSNEKQYGIHPTQKPEFLFEHFIKLLTNQNDIVLDPFMGSGTTGVASNKLGRKFIGCELNTEYYNGAKTRINRVNSSQITFKSGEV